MITLDVDGEIRQLTPDVLVIAGYTGADADAVQHHIDELAEVGVAPPPRVPMYWSAPATGLTQAGVVDVPSAGTSGEIELALVRDGDDLLVTVGSDHTCREAEAIDIRLSKLICPTPIGRRAWHWQSVADQWRDVQLTSEIEIDGRTESYQAAAAGGNRSPIDLLDGIPWTDEPPTCFVLLCGTAPTIGPIRPANRFWGSASRPDGASLDLEYRIQPAPAVAGVRPDGLG